MQFAFETSLPTILIKTFLILTIHFLFVTVFTKKVADIASCNERKWSSRVKHSNSLNGFSLQWKNPPTQYRLCLIVISQIHFNAVKSSKSSFFNDSFLNNSSRIIYVESSKKSMIDNVLCLTISYGQFP